MTWRAGTSVMGAVGVHQTTAEIMSLQAITPEETQPVLMPEHEFERGHLRNNPASPRVASIPVMKPDQLMRGQSSGVGILSPQTVGVNVRTATFSGGPWNTGAFPPDNDGAVGPTQYIVSVNGRIVSFNKTTGAADGVLNASTNTFFTSVRSGSGTSDPMIRYDRLSGRWFVSIINVSTPNRWLLAVSDAASNGTITLSTVWTYYFFIPATTPPTISNGSTCLSDYPSLGVDNNALYMSVNEFCGTGQPFQQTDVFVIRKTSVLSGGPIVVTAFRAVMSAPSVGGTYDGPYAARGVDNYDPTANEGYFLGVDGNAYGLLDFIRVANPGATPSISSNIPITVPQTSAPLTVPHLGNTGGTNGNLDGLDDRLFQAHIRNGRMWTAQNIKVDNTGVVNATDASNTRNGSRWYEFSVPVGSGTPTIVQSGIVFTATGSNLTTEKHYWIPSIMVSGQGHAAMGFTTAGTNDRVHAGTVGRLASDPLGTMETPVDLTGTAASAYNPPGDTGASRGARRWGDYSITSLDPIDDMSIWTVQEYCDSTNRYACRVARLIAPGPAAPSALADITAGPSPVSVTLTGTSASGSGFYDPGSNLPSVPAFSHLTAAITNGGATGTPPAVISATYVDPTTVNLVLNASSATTNVGSEKYTIAITNPDGQVLAAAIVHVTASTITASAGPGGTISPSGAVIVPSGGNQTFTIIPADPCHFISGVLVDGVPVGAVSSYTFTNVTANHTIAASFGTLGPYTITASAGTGGTISPAGAVSVTCGTNKTFAINVADKCHFISDVKVDGVSVGAVASYTFTNVSANHTITATFGSFGPFTITASAGTGGSISPSGATSVACGASQTFAINVADKCHVVADVKVDGVSVGAVASYTFTDVQANHTIAATFSALGPFTITASAGSGGSISPSGATSVPCGGSKTFTIDVADKCHFIADVKVDGVSVGAVSSYTFSDVQANHTIAATFGTFGPFTITATAGSGGSISPAGATSVACGGSKTYTINVADKCHFLVDVKVDGVSVGAVFSYTFSDVQANHTIDATFGTFGPFTITATAGSGGSISPAGATSVACGGSKTYTINVADKCHFLVDVKVDGVSVGAVFSYTFSDVQANHTIDATFGTYGPFTITATAGSGGSISPAGATTVNCGGSKTFTIDAADKCHFVADVKVDGVSVGAVFSYTFTDVQANHTIDATFGTYVPFTITATAGSGGTISPAGAISVNCGGSKTFTIDVADKCHFIADVKVDGVSVGAVSTYTFTDVQANHTIDATFGTYGPFTITATAGAGGTISPAGATSVTCGGSKTLTIDVADKCHFVADVKVDGVSVGAVFSYTFTDVQANHTIDATFGTYGPFTITATAGSGGSISPVGATSVACGGSKTYAIDVADKCHFVADVKVDGVSVGAVASYTFSDVQANHTIAATFGTYGPFTITATAGSGGSISPAGAVSVDCGGSKTFTIDVADKCHFLADVKVDGVSVGAVFSYTFADVQANHTIDATFGTYGPFTITATAGAGGTISPAGAVAVACGANKTFSIDVADKCHFIADVKVDGVSVGAVASYTFADVQANHTIDATFGTYGPFTVTATAGSGGSITPSGPTIVNCGDSQTFDIAPVIGYAIDDVKADGVSVGAVASYTFPDVQADHTIDASFRLVTAVFSAFEASTVYGGVELTWHIDGGSATSVSVERSEASTGPWKRITVDMRTEASMTIADDYGVEADKAYYYRVVVAWPGGSTTTHGPILGTSGDFIRELALAAIPNPTSGAVRVDYALPKRGSVDLTVVDIQGRLVAAILHEEQGPGRHQAAWDGRSDRGPAPTGLYFLRLKANGRIVTHRLVIAR